MRECVCDNCGMEFEVERLDVTNETLKDEPVEVVSFTCPKCDERYIIAVRDDHSAQLQKEFQKVHCPLQDRFRTSCHPCG